MSTIRKTFKVGSTLTDMTSVELARADAVYGVKRTDTDAVVVASGTAMTKQSTGVYEHTFADPASGLEYAYSIKYVYAGATYYFPGEFDGPVDGYCARGDIENLNGINNVSKWSDLDNDADATKITDRIAVAIAAVGDKLDAELRYSRYAIPVANSGTTPTVIRDLCAQMAAVWLYESRGVIDFDADGQVQHALHWQKREAKQMLRKILAGQVVLTADLKSDIDNLNTAPRIATVALEE